MTVAELLKSKGIADEVISGLPKEISAHLEGYLSEADTKLTAAQQDAQTAEEARRQAELEKKEAKDYVERYGNSLVDFAGNNAKIAATAAYLKTLKEQGFDVPANLLEADPNPNPNPNPQARVPGSPAMGGNAFDPERFRGEVGSVMSQWLDANNEHIRLFGTPIPEASTPLNMEAARARMPVGEYIAKKFKFAERREAQAKEAYDARVKADVDKEVQRQRQADAERNGSNPNLRPGEASRNSFVRPIKGEEFHKSDGNIPGRVRRGRLLEKIHADVREAQSA